MGKSANEFPMLGALGLYAAPTTGYGNCLFIALSDQLYGDDSHNQQIRARVVEFMREHADYFKPFIPVNLGGGERRNRRRKNAGIYSATFDLHQPTEDETDLQYGLKLKNMAKQGTFGDHMEIMAFSGAYGVDVKVHQAPGTVNDITAANMTFNGVELVEQVERPIAHIAYHMHEHYSTVRSLHNNHLGVFQEAATIDDTSSSWSDYSSPSDYSNHITIPLPKPANTPNVKRIISKAAERNRVKKDSMRAERKAKGRKSAWAGLPSTYQNITRVISDLHI